MKTKNNEEEKILNDINKSGIFFQNQLQVFLQKLNFKIFIFLILLTVNNIIIMFELSNKSGHFINNDKKINLENRVYNNIMRATFSKKIQKHLQKRLIKERNRPYLKEINKKRTFEKRFPLAKEINCKTHFSDKELLYKNL